MSDDQSWPGWLRDVTGTLAVSSQYVLWGAIRDAWLVPGEQAPKRLLAALQWALTPLDYQAILVWDPIDGIQTFPAGENERTRVQQLVEHDLGKGGSPLDFPTLQSLLRHVVTKLPRVAFVLDYASRITSDAEHPGPDEGAFFAFAQKLSYTAIPMSAPDRARRSLFNPVIWLLDRQGDIPAWYTAQNERVRVIPLAAPDLGQRLQAGELAIGGLDDVAKLDHERRRRLVRAFAESTEGMTIAGMYEVVKLARDRSLPATQISDAVRAYKVGLLESPWRAGYLPRRIRDGESELRARVIGQDDAVTRTMDILKRSVMGLSGAHTSQRTNRPRGVLFFAGPTGVGKTELAKALAGLLFGNDEACIRFDMSEFREENADQRLIGAPPGFLGHEAGGELTNAVRNRPFSLLLFDEIDKAGPKVLDKFLQILDEGRLTDGRGATVHFSEAVIVFTSNLGMVGPDGEREVTQKLDHAAIDTKIRASIKHHFTSVLNRPELLNRIGESNVVVFDYIRPEPARLIFGLQLANVEARVHEEHRAHLIVEEPARSQLLQWVTTDLDFGGRGMGSRLEEALENPLGRALFDRGVKSGDKIVVTGIRREGLTHVVDLG